MIIGCWLRALGKVAFDMDYDSCIANRGSWMELECGLFQVKVGAECLCMVDEIS